MAIGIHQQLALNEYRKGNVFPNKKELGYVATIFRKVINWVENLSTIFSKLD